MPSDDASPTEVARPPAARATAVVALIACAVVLVASIGAGALVHWVQRETGSSSTSIQAAAWFQGTAVSEGVTVLAPIQFVVVPTSSAPVTWVATNNGRVYQRGVAHGKPGSDVVVTLATWTMKPGTWLTIGISGVRTPLKAWVR